jgi:cytochrome oxidase Cu insertion factor (SCO1/SenC/PrrC family)
VTTGALLVLERQVAAQHLTSKAAIVEVTVDPGRDTPHRMATYAKLTGVSWPLLTASPATIGELWHFFGIYYQVVSEGSPPGIDWQTDQPLHLRPQPLRRIRPARPASDPASS